MIVNGGTSKEAGQRGEAQSGERTTEEMTTRTYEAAIRAHENQATFTPYEAACILAQVEPNSDMKESEALAVAECLRFHGETKEWRRKLGDDALFDKLIA